MKVLAISGSLRAASFNTALLRTAADLAPEGVEIVLYEGLDRLPHYNEDHDHDEPSAEVARLRREIRDADALVIATPEFNGTLPGHLKAAVDWASRPYGKESSLWGKPVLLAGVSVTDYGAMWAQDHLRRALGIAGARVLENAITVPRANDRFDATGRLTDGDTRAELVTGLEQLQAGTEALAPAA
jgi:chromate reductase